MKFLRKYWIPTSIIAALIVIELALRLVFGLGNPVLIQADADTGYRVRPNQTVFRFGKKAEYNQYSQRSATITANKPQGTLRILMIGDSILNGGNLADQAQTISELLKAQLAASRQPTEVLNASTASWAIENRLGYLRKFGTFESDVVIVQIGTDDLTQPTSTSAGVEHNPAYPTQAPLLAIQEVLTRYAWPKLASLIGFDFPTPLALLPGTEELNRQFQQNLQSLTKIVTLVRAKKMPIFILFTPNLNNLMPTFNVPEYKPEFLQLLNSLQVRVIDAHNAWSSLPKKTVEAFFRSDGVHLSVPGNEAIANLLFEKLCIERQLPACSR
ncbi:MAG TPA: SGNH/GDSL hydrolase family protein [Candidatus Sericytochromatia bacterium]|jgi:lysophospholipase L1-like esterase